MSKGVAGSERHLIWGRCAKVEMPEKAHYYMINFLISGRIVGEGTFKRQG